MPKKENSKEMQKLISEITSLEDDLKEFRKSIKKVKDAPYKKQGESEVVGTQHEELVTELEDIANRLEELPKKWEGE
ncbi:MAG: hypothetical protein KAS07_02690 [Candidatus Pacebacteria bacterium]|nr:hypothetical protein [Candidatus Paceibacterota bacterium]